MRFSFVALIESRRNNVNDFCISLTNDAKQIDSSICSHVCVNNDVCVFVLRFVARYDLYASFDLRNAFASIATFDCNFCDLIFAKRRFITSPQNMMCLCNDIRAKFVYVVICAIFIRVAYVVFNRTRMMY